MTSAPPPQRRWLRLGHLELSDLLVETFSVLLGVLLALAINAWVQARQTQHKLAEAQASIREELIADRERVVISANYYHHLNEAIDAALKTAQPPQFCDKLPEWHGLITPLFVRAAYDTAASSGIFVEMNFEATRRIASLYAELSRYETFYGKVEDWLGQSAAVNNGAGFNLSLCHGFSVDLEHSALKVQEDLDAYLGPSAAHAKP
jgi:hypothetical protein